MSTELVNLAELGALSTGTGLDADTLAVAGGNRQGNKRISIKGGVFRKYAGGKEIGAIEDRFMNVIFVKMAHSASRMYYSSGYVEGQKISPTCWSTDSNKPDSDVPKPESYSCKDCHHSVKGSSENGMGSKCRLSWRAAVVLPNDPAGDVMQLVLPATSSFGKEDNGRWPFRPYVQHLASHNVSAGRVISRMAFDTKSPVPKVFFSPAGAVPDADLQIIARQAKNPIAEAAVKLNVYQTDTNEVYVAPPTPEEMLEPVKRESSKDVGEKAGDISEVINKWAKKKG
jgi:hypothetical protein